MDPTKISVVILMVGVAVAGLVWLRSSMVAGSARRTTDMMKRIGLNPEMVALGDPRTTAVGKELRRRCGKCPSEGHCEQWLAGKIKGGNSFCLNAATFRGFARASAPALKLLKT